MSGEQRKPDAKQDESAPNAGADVTPEERVPNSAGEDGQVADEASSATTRSTSRRESTSDFDGESAEPQRAIREEAINERVRARNLFTANTFSGTVFINGDDGEVLEAVDHTADASELLEHFAAPANFEDILTAVAPGRITLLHGQQGLGKRACAKAALTRQHYSPIFELSAAYGMAHLRSALSKLVRQNPAAGFIIADVDKAFLFNFTRFRAQSIKQILHAPNGAAAALIITTDEEPPNALDQISSVAYVAADVSVMLSTILANESDSYDRVLRLCQHLELRGFAEVKALAELVDQNSDTSDESLLANYQADAGKAMLDEWLSQHHPLEAYAHLIATAACEFGTYAEVMDVAAALDALYRRGDRPREVDLDAIYRDIGTGSLTTTTREDYYTEFGIQKEEVIHLVSPLSQMSVIDSLWRAASHRLQRAVIAWLDLLVQSERQMANLGAAVVAGTLFSTDARHIERDVIGPWAWSGEPAKTRAAGIALGLPVLLQRESSGARALAYAWSTSSVRSLRESAISAYGGPMGAWDPESNAPTNLWRIGALDPKLEFDANLGLAQLTVAGHSAARSRAAVIALLSNQLKNDRRRASRVYSAFAFVVLFLCFPNRNANQSLKALVAEGETYEAFQRLLGNCLLRSRYDVAEIVVHSLVRATAGDRLSQQQLIDLIRSLKTVAKSGGELPRLGSRLRSLLHAVKNSETAKRGPIAEIAEDLLWQFFEARVKDSNGGTRSVRA